MFILIHILILTPGGTVVVILLLTVIIIDIGNIYYLLILKAFKIHQMMCHTWK